ncbi:MAG: Undecaprenyl-diphosphatase [Candidatus Levybacteria bacterium]|nr:Undecaprenyl-diphosphatase [Candidatus Levybacteria bacterium]
MDYLQAIILSIVEGLTEFLPISSTGHMVLASKILNIAQTEFVKSFEIIIQLGSILAVIFLYWKTILKNKKIWKKIIVAFIPTAIVGFALYKTVKSVFLGNPVIALYALFIGGILLIFLEKIYKEKEHHADSIDKISSKNAFLIGVFQSFSIIPGVSRAAATIIPALFLGTKRKTAVEFSFLLAIPTMLAATALDLVKSNFSFTPSEYSILIVGFIGAFIVAIFAVKFLLNFIKKHTFIPFGIYRIILAIVFWLTVLK